MTQDDREWGERRTERKKKTGTGVPASQCRKESTTFNENILKIIATIATGQER